MKKYLPVLICLFFAIILLVIALGQTNASNINTYPNLPAPIGDEKILITSAGQAVESAIMQTISEDLNLEADYRPRALATDLYDYRTVVIAIGYSTNGLAQTTRSFQEEMTRVKQLMLEADRREIPVVLINLSGALREDDQTWKLAELTIPHATYFIGLDTTKQTEKLFKLLKRHHVPTTLVNQLDDIHTPLNSVFR
ncbi:DUF6305 family protein [Ornithinibacillus salinisoli]|uniref:DUF6305 family protein n=1 Tax=Ornithinibacillus salinisoli TaxID=1848459 RepID=A0ABW4VV53_9BACI